MTYFYDAISSSEDPQAPFVPDQLIFEASKAQNVPKIGVDFPSSQMSKLCYQILLKLTHFFRQNAIK